MGLMWWLSRENCKPDEPSPIPDPQWREWTTPQSSPLTSWVQSRVPQWKERTTPQRSPLASMMCTQIVKWFTKVKNKNRWNAWKETSKKNGGPQPHGKGSVWARPAREAVLDFPLVLFLAQVPMKLKLTLGISCRWGLPRIPNPSASQVRGWQACATISSISQEGWQRPGAQN